MSQQIDELIKKEFEENVDKLLKKEIKHFSTNYMSVSKIIEHFTKLGFEDNEDLDTNGWQWDFWCSMQHAEYGKLKLGGCGYYGGVTVELTKNKNED